MHLPTSPLQRSSNAAAFKPGEGWPSDLPPADRKRARDWLSVDWVAAAPTLPRYIPNPAPERIPSPGCPADFLPFAEEAMRRHDVSEEHALRQYLDPQTDDAQLDSLVRIYLRSSDQSRAADRGLKRPEIKKFGAEAYLTKHAMQGHSGHFLAILARLDHERRTNKGISIVLHARDQQVLQEHGMRCLRSAYSSSEQKARIFEHLALSQEIALPSELFHWASAYVLRQADAPFDMAEQVKIVQAIAEAGAQRSERLDLQLAQRFISKIEKLLTTDRSQTLYNLPTIHAGIEAASGRLLNADFAGRERVALAAVDGAVRVLQTRAVHAANKNSLIAKLLPNIISATFPLGDAQKAACLSILANHIVESAFKPAINGSTFLPTQQAFFQYLAELGTSAHAGVSPAQITALIRACVGTLDNASIRSVSAFALRRHLISQLSNIGLRHKIWPAECEWPHLLQSISVLNENDTNFEEASSIIAHVGSMIAERGSSQLSHVHLDVIVKAATAIPKSSRNPTTAPLIDKTIRSLKRAEYGEQPPALLEVPNSEPGGSSEPIFSQMSEAGLDAWLTALQAEQSEFENHAYPLIEAPAPMAGSFADPLHRMLATHIANGAHVAASAETLLGLADHALYMTPQHQLQDERIFTQIRDFLQAQTQTTARGGFPHLVARALQLRAASSLPRNQAETAALMAHGLDALRALGAAERNGVANDIICGLIDLKNAAAIQIDRLQRLELMANWFATIRDMSTSSLSYRNIFRSVSREPQGNGPAAFAGEIPRLPAVVRTSFDILANPTLNAAQRSKSYAATIESVTRLHVPLGVNDQMILVESLGLSLKSAHTVDYDVRREMLKAFTIAEPRLRSIIPPELYRLLSAQALDVLAALRSEPAKDVTLLMNVLFGANKRRCRLTSFHTKAVIQIAGSFKKLEQDIEHKLGALLLASISKGILPYAGLEQSLLLEVVFKKSLDCIAGADLALPPVKTHLLFLNEASHRLDFPLPPDMRSKIDELLARLGVADAPS